jgi:molybdopterin converting factor small subunit
MAMAITIQIPATLRHECAGRRVLDVSATTVQEALDALAADYPQVYRCVCDETGAVRRHMHLFVNDTLIGGRQRLTQPLGERDILTIMTAVSGG